MFKAKQYGQAADMFAAYATTHEKNPWGFYMLGLSAWKGGQLDRAQKAFEDALALDPKHVKSLVNLSRVLLEEGKPGDALDRATAAIAIDSGSSDAYRVLGRVQTALGHFDDAIDAYHTAVTLDPAWIDEAADGVILLCEQSSWCWPAHDDTRRVHGAVVPTVTAAGQGRYVAANVVLFMPGTWELRTTITDAAGAASDTLAHGEIQSDRSRALVAQGKLDDAAAALTEARRDAPQNADGWLLSATLSRRKGDLGAAQAQIETAAGLDPKNPQVGLEAGVIAALAGHDDAARKSWQSVIDTSPAAPEAETARTYLAEIGGGSAPTPAPATGGETSR